MNRAKIILLCFASAIIYGVLHDQVTARLCIEYFTVAHPPLFSATSPTMIALCWGIATTAGIGAVFGLVVAQIAHAGSDRPLAASQLVGPLVRLFVAMALCALAAGASGYILAQRGMISVPVAFAASVPEVRHHQFMAVWFAHGASYLVGLAGGANLAFHVWRERGKPSALPALPRSPKAVLRATLLAIVAAYVLWMRFSGD